MSYTYTSRNPRAATNPLRSMVWNKPACQVMGWTPLQIAEFNLGKARIAVTHLTACLRSAYLNLGEQNRRRNPILRRMGQAAVFRTINGTRAQLRTARAALVAAELAMLTFAAAA